MLQKRSPAYDKDLEEHYNLISASTSPSAIDPRTLALLPARMPGRAGDLLAARRLVASEDIGEADPMSLVLAGRAGDAYDFLGR